MVKRKRLIVTLQYIGCLVEILSYEMNAADEIRIFLKLKRTECKIRLKLYFKLM